MEVYWPVISMFMLLIGASVTSKLSKRDLESLSSELREQRSATAKAREGQVRAEAERDASHDHIRQIKEDRDSIKESLKAYSAEQLERSRRQFIEHAEQRLTLSEEKHTSELNQRHEQIEKQFVAFKIQMERFQAQHHEIERDRTASFASLNEQVSHLAHQTVKVGEEARALSTVLKGSSQSRGRWGEMALKNICELAGMTAHCDFYTQVHGDDGKRPDVVVRIPNDGMIPIDAKVPFADYDRAINSVDLKERERHFSAHAITVRQTMIELSKRKYSEQHGMSVDFTIMFIPIESVAAAAFSALPELAEEAIRRKVLITTPVTLIALLKTIAIYWQQENLANNAKKLWDEYLELHKRLSTFTDHLGKVGGALNRAVKCFNDAIGSFDRRLLPHIRKIEDLSARSDDSSRIEDLKLIEEKARKYEK